MGSHAEPRASPGSPVALPSMQEGSGREETSPQDFGLNQRVAMLNQPTMFKHFCVLEKITGLGLLPWIISLGKIECKSGTIKDNSSSRTKHQEMRFTYFILLCVSVFCLHVSMHYMCACRSPKRASYSLVLEFQTIVSLHERRESGIEARSSGRAAGALSHWVISPALKMESA